MKGDLQGRQPLPQSLKFMSINVGRGGTSHDIALARGCELQLDVLLIQEPWWSERTKSHPYFDRHVPYGGTNVRPRVVTYTRKKSTEISAIQIFPTASPTGDYCWVVVNNITFLNVYKAPRDPAAVQPLLNWNPPPLSVISGDFNSVYWAWQPGVVSCYGQGEEIESWAERHNLSCLIIGEPTHRAGNTLDLAWSNISGTCAWVDREECVTSDHFPVCGYVPNFRPSEAISRGPLKVPKDKLPQYANVVSQWIPPLSVLDTEEEVERFAQQICLALTDALKAVGRRSNKAAGRSAPWWTTECKHAKSEYRAATTETERFSRAKYLRATVASAKKEYWKKQVETITSLSDTFKVMRWASPCLEKIPPPLLYEGRLVSDQEERASILRDNLLARYQASDDLPPTILAGENK
ncbi:hypothetical protein K3495_g15679, partial [Podosphaera aphanis]